MKITLVSPALILCLTLILISCSAENMGELQAEDLKAANLEVYEVKDLEGIWDLYSMHSDVAVDFNGDDTTNTDIMVETDCFKTMFYDFDSTGNVTATQAKLHINATGISSCNIGVYSSPYTIKDDMLTVSFHDKNGTLITTTKQIKLTEDKQFLHLSLTRLEASAYIKDDSGNSTAVIDSIATVYKKRVVAPAG